MTQLQIHPSTKCDRRVSDRALKASVTIEAALAVPLFMFAVLSLIFVMEIKAIQYSVEHAAVSAAKLSAQEIPELSGLDLITLKYHIVKLVGEDRLERSIIVNGSSGVTCLGSTFNKDTGMIHVRVSYRVRLPFPEYTGITLLQTKTFEVKAWTGYQGAGEDSDGDNRIVYVTDSGSVYHEDLNCSFLNPSIKTVSLSAVGSDRNVGGGKYYPCPLCAKKGFGSQVYVTEYGTCYHSSTTCSGLKRTVHAVHLKDVGSLPPCSKCGHQGN